MSQVSRRRFLESTLQSGIAASVGTSAVTGLLAQATGDNKKTTPSEKINVACIGVRGRGDALLRTFARQKDVNILYVCDIDANVLASRSSAVEKITKREVKRVSDYRKILDDKNVDAVTIGTPDHWHALPAIHACQAGKDVYVEKPDGHNINEGKMMVAASQKYKRMMQMGTQARSAPYMHEAKKFVADGGIGKVLFGKAWESARQGAIPRVADSSVPKGVDYDRWLGPAPERPFNRYRFHGNWRWFFDYGCGDLGNDGVHRLDYCRMVMGLDQMPHTVSCSGGKLFFDDAQEWPDTMMAVYEFGGKTSNPKMMMTYEMRLWSKPKLHGVTEGGAVYGENGWVLMTNGKWAAYDHKEKVIKQGGDGSANQLHVRNFLDAVRSRRSGDLNQGIESGHISSALCHLGNIAWRTGRKFQFDAKSETTSDAKVNEYLSRQYRKGYELPHEL
jgi:predicted dehydrogenase